jgi:hypothetical protein
LLDRHYHSIGGVVTRSILLLFLLLLLLLLLPCHRGDLLLKNGGKIRIGPYHNDIVSSIGWWTDNGGYYHYPGGSIEANKVSRVLVEKLVEMLTLTIG